MHCYPSAESCCSFFVPPHVMHLLSSIPELFLLISAQYLGSKKAFWLLFGTWGKIESKPELMFNMLLMLFVASLFFFFGSYIANELQFAKCYSCPLWLNSGKYLPNLQLCFCQRLMNFSGAEMKFLVCSNVLRQVTGCQLRHVNLPHTHATCLVPRQNKFNFLKASGKGSGNESEPFHHQQLSILLGSGTHKSHGLFGSISSSHKCQMCPDTWP